MITKTKNEDAAGGKRTFDAARNLTVQVDPALKRKLAKIARAQQRSISFVLRAAAEQYIASQEAAA